MSAASPQSVCPPTPCRFSLVLRRVMVPGWAVCVLSWRLRCSCTSCLRLARLRWWWRRWWSGRGCCVWCRRWAGSWCCGGPRVVGGVELVVVVDAMFGGAVVVAWSAVPPVWGWSAVVVRRVGVRGDVPVVADGVAVGVRAASVTVGAVLGAVVVPLVVDVGVAVVCSLASGAWLASLWLASWSSWCLRLWPSVACASALRGGRGRRLAASARWRRPGIGGQVVVAPDCVGVGGVAAAADVVAVFGASGGCGAVGGRGRAAVVGAVVWRVVGGRGCRRWAAAVVVGIVVGGCGDGVGGGRWGGGGVFVGAGGFIVVVARTAGGSASRSAAGWRGSCWCGCR